MGAANVGVGRAHTREAGRMKTKRHRKQCRKLGYQTKSAAREALNRMKHTGVKRFYKCPYCDVWHLTSESR